MKEFKMRKLSVVAVCLLAVVLLFACGGCQKKEQKPTTYTLDEVAATYEKNIVEIVAFGSGTGIVLKNDTESGLVHILTCLHVLYDSSQDLGSSIPENLLNVECRFYGETAFSEYTATVVGFYKAYDMLVLSVSAESDAIDILPAHVGGAGLKTGAQLLLTGNAAGRGIVAYDGIVSKPETAVKFENRSDYAPVFALSVPVQPGVSGGAVADTSGKIVGMAAGRDDEIGIGYALPFNVLYALYTRMASNPKNGEPYSVFAKVSNDANEGLALSVPLSAGSLRFSVDIDAYTVSKSSEADITVGTKVIELGGVKVSDGLFAVLERLASFEPDINGESVLLSVVKEGGVKTVAALF